MDYYVSLDDGSVHGPYSRNRLSDFVGEGRISRSTRVRAASSQDWIRLDELINFGPSTPAEAVAPPPPPPPPPLTTKSTAAPRAASDDPAIRLVIPVAVEPVALVAGYLGLFSLVLFPAPFALAAGLWALARLKGRSDVHGAGRAWTAIVLGSLGTIGLAVFILSRI